MSKEAKKKAKLVERLESLELELRTALQKKSSSASEIDVPGKTAQIAALRKQISEL